MARKLTFKLSCSVQPETYQEVVRLVKWGLWPDQAAFVRDAIEAQLRRIQIRERLIQEGIRAEHYPESPEELLAELESLKERVKELRDKIDFGEHTPATLLDELYSLREGTSVCYRAAETLHVPSEVVQTLRGLVDKDSSGPSFHKAELALKTFLEYLRSPFARLPKSDVETWREVSRIAGWKQSAHTELTRIVSTTGRVLQQLIGFLSAGKGPLDDRAEITTQGNAEGE
ncbi:MAG: hypothetical protein QXI12_05410 [Candidatus Methanomethyliaceae archaeon]